MVIFNSYVKLPEGREVDYMLGVGGKICLVGRESQGGGIHQ